MRLNPSCGCQHRSTTVVQRPLIGYWELERLRNMVNEARQNNLTNVILGFDPGRDKCGLAVIGGTERQLLYHQVVPSQAAIATIQQLCQQFPIQTLVMGNQTTAKTWKQKLSNDLSISVPIVLVDERYSSLQARDRYWQMYPPKGLQRLIPQGMREPPRPIDDIVAILLIERYLGMSDTRK